jgi:hypothetical protein
MAKSNVLHVSFCVQSMSYHDKNRRLLLPRAYCLNFCRNSRMVSVVFVLYNQPCVGSGVRRRGQALSIGPNSTGFLHEEGDRVQYQKRSLNKKYRAFQKSFTTLKTYINLFEDM